MAHSDANTAEDMRGGDICPQLLSIVSFGKHRIMAARVFHTPALATTSNIIPLHFFFLARQA